MKLLNLADFITLLQEKIIIIKHINTTSLVGVASSVLEILLPFKNVQISLLGHGL